MLCQRRFLTGMLCNGPKACFSMLLAHWERLACPISQNTRPFSDSVFGIYRISKRAEAVAQWAVSAEPCNLAGPDA